VKEKGKEQQRNAVGGKYEKKIETRTQNRKKKTTNRDLNITRMFQCHNEYRITVKESFRSSI
jgi:hypothetical protein